MERRHFCFPALTGRANLCRPFESWSCADKRFVASGIEQKAGNDDGVDFWVGSVRGGSQTADPSLRSG